MLQESRCHGLWMLVWILCTTVFLMPVCLDGAISVHFKTGRSLYVALGETLVLEAVFKKNPDDKIDMVTWDRDRSGEIVRLSGTQGSRISLEKGDSLLRITNVTKVDIAFYKVTVTDSNGDQQHASIEVRQIVERPKALALRVLECALEKHDMMQWDSLQFSWMIDGVTVTNQTALLADGSRLDISQVEGVNYTCIIKSSLGTVTTHYVIPKESQTCCKVLIALGVIIAIAVCVVTGLYIWKRSSSRQDRNRVSQDSQ